MTSWIQSNPRKSKTINVNAVMHCMLSFIILKRTKELTLKTKPTVLNKFISNVHIYIYNVSITCLLHASIICLLHASITYLLHASITCLLHVSITCLLHVSITCLLHVYITCLHYMSPLRLLHVYITCLHYMSTFACLHYMSTTYLHFHVYITCLLHVYIYMSVSIFFYFPSASNKMKMCYQRIIDLLKLQALLDLEMHRKETIKEKTSF